MISWLQGHKVDKWEHGSKQGVVLACGGVGYEVQLTPRHQTECGSRNDLILWIHQVHREDGPSLFGFPEKKERDLFRRLIGVNGVGPQIALALIQESAAEELIKAIVQADIGQLTKAQGIGKRTAERISLELRNKLCQESFNSSLFITEEIQESKISQSSLYEIEETLHGLGFEDLEIHRAIKALLNTGEKHTSKKPQKLPLPEDTEAWIKASLIYLSKEAA